MKLLLAVSLSLFLSACAAVAPAPSAAGDPAPSGLRGKLIADLNQAIADNGKATDLRAPIRLQCWQTLLELVPATPSLPGGITYDSPSAGVFDTVERAGAVVENFEELSDAQIPDEVLVKLELGCGPVALRARGLRDKFLIRFVRLGSRVGILLK